MTVSDSIERHGECELLCGIISVKAAICAGSREIYHVYADAEKFKKRDRKITAFLSFLKEHGIRAELCRRSEIDAFAASFGEEAGNTHGGVVAAVGKRRYCSIGDILDETAKSKGFCVFLDGIEDPFNLGYAIRSLYACGACGVILPPRDRSGMTAVLARSSAGASELIPIAELADSTHGNARTAFAAECDRIGIHRACAAVSSTSTSIFDYDGTFPMIIFIGGEKRGISPEFIEGAELIHIPYASPDIRYSLPSASVAAIMGAELMRIRTETKMRNF